MSNKKPVSEQDDVRLDEEPCERLRAQESAEVIVFPGVNARRLVEIWAQDCIDLGLVKKKPTGNS